MRSVQDNRCCTMKRRDLFRIIGAVGVISLPLYGLARAQTSSPRSAAMSNVNEVIVRYLAAWNEREPKRRRDLVAKSWPEDGTYVDRGRDGRGHDSLDAMIATAQE